MAQELYRSNSDEAVRNDLQLWADHAQRQRWLLKQSEGKALQLAKQDKQLEELNKKLDGQNTLLSSKDKELDIQNKQLIEQASLITTLQAELIALKSGQV